jgi:sigma-B regulation protein RsbU (phosphoserine phosphatase)
MAENILIVDDDEDVRSVMTLLLQRAGYNIVPAVNGAEGLEKAQGGNFDLMLLDVRMPGLNGFEVCQKLRGDARTQRLPVIFLTCLDEVESRVKGLDLGAVDYVSKSASTAELLARIRTQFRLQTLMRDLEKANAELRTRQMHLDEDLRAAAVIQRSLLPSKSPRFSNLEVAWKFLPCETVAGDIFNLQRIGEEVVFYVLDVSGHGVPAAMVAVSAAQSIEAMHRVFSEEAQPADPAGVVRSLDRAYPLERFNKYFTMLYCSYHPRSCLLRYVNAGHPAALLLRENGSLETLDEAGPIVGLGGVVPYVNSICQLNKGDKVIMYTDGATDCRNAAGQAFGEDRLKQLCNEHRASALQTLLDQVAQTLAGHSAGAPASDDISMLAFECK